MTRTNLENGGYTLTASDGFDLIALDADGIEVARTKNVTIPLAGTALLWVEVSEVLWPVVDEKVKRIAELEAELAVLRG